MFNGVTLKKIISLDNLILVLVSQAASFSESCSQEQKWKTKLFVLITIDRFEKSKLVLIVSARQKILLQQTLQ